MKYKLYAVLVHSGYSSNSGHYYCYVRAPNGTWYHMNDSIVSAQCNDTCIACGDYLQSLQVQNKLLLFIKSPAGN